jgi:hypothetical protein
MLDTDEYPSDRTVPKHKTYQRNFLIWVAYKRKQSRNIDETERRTCPLKGCEEAPFDTHDAMLDHIYTCPYLVKGSYKCCECGQSERISKIHTNGCHQLRRFSSVANSLRRAKRLLSSHGPKGRNGSQSAAVNQATSEKYAVLTPPQDDRRSEPFLGHTGFTVELETPWIPEIHELDIPAEFAAYDNYMTSRQHPGAQLQNGCSELSASHGCAHVLTHQLCHQQCHQHVPIELSTGYNSTWSPAEDRRQQCSRHVQSLANAFPSSTQDDRQHSFQDQFDNAGHSYTSYDDARVSRLQSPVSPISAHDHPTCPSLTSSASRTNSDISAISFGSIYPSRDTSMSSISSLCSRPENYEKPPFRFLTEEGRNLLFSEPELMGESIKPVELPTRVETSPLNWFGDESSQIFLEPESMEEPVQPAELPTSSNSSSLAHIERNPNWMFLPELMGDSIAAVEMPTYSNENSRPFHLGSSIPESFPVQHGTSGTIQTPDMEAQIASKLSSPQSTSLSDHSSHPPGSMETSSKVRCSCGFEPSGKEVYKASNLKRHQSTRNCLRYSPYRRPKTAKSWPCPYPGCPKTFTRSDNLRVHQKQKRHLLEVELLQRCTYSFQPEAAALQEMLERHRYQGREPQNNGGSIWK